MTSTTLREMLVKQEPRYVTKCYVCSGLRAEYVVYSKPFRDGPFFPFLEHHQPPEGAENMRSDGRVLTCLVCYTFLNQQWDSHEKSNTPYNKRLYWLKRLDGGPFAGMEVNLQQDYESLFESSNAAIETESRPKPKVNRNHHLTDAEPMKAKQSERSNPLNFSFSSQSSDKPENSVSSILDLSMSTRVPSRSSSSASPGVVSEVCYACGQEAKTLVNVYVKFVRNCPYFPSLAALPKPPRAKPIDMDGKIHVCSHCHLYLIQQYDSYQKQNTPHHERLYKTTPDVVKSEIQVNNKSFVCYTCGMISELSVQRFINAHSEGEGTPHYSFLLHSTPHPGANKLSKGKASVCSLCYKGFLRQFQVYEVSKTPEEHRKYRTLNENVADSSSMLRRHLESMNEKIECYLCESVAEKFYSVGTLPASDMYFPFIKGLQKPTSAFPMDDRGQVKVCGQCHMSLTYQWTTFENAFIPINQRQYKIPGSKVQVENHYMQSVPHPPSHPKSNSDEYKFPSKKTPGDSCGLCDNSLSPETACIIETLPRENCMYFPSVRSLIKPSNLNYSIDQYGRILACNLCFATLKKQWEVFESAHVPHAQRQYEIFTAKLERERSHFGSDILSETSSALHIQVSSPDLKMDMAKHPSNVETLLTTVNTLPISSITISNAGITSANSPQLNDLKSTKSITDDPIPRICGPLDVPFIRPLVLVVPIACFVCGEMNPSSVTFPIRSQPVPDSRMDKTSDEVPFFPFLTKHHIPEGAEKLSNDGNALACMFCYHSLVSQWLAYETSTYPEDDNRWLRRYNTHNYVCYICGITTYRKRVCSISVKNFPFLLEHPRPAGALTILNGECVVTCQTCFESITSQWKDFERMKVPVEMRKYNWIVLPAPPDDENSRGCKILENSGGSLLGLSQSEGEQPHLDDTGIPHGLKAPPSHLPVPSPYGVAKPGGRNVMSPVHQGAPHPNAAFSPFANSHNPALNATRTSSFAAALRKLAKQAVDPIAEKDLSPISPASSPASSQQSGHGRYHTPLPMYLNSHTTPGQGSPTPTVPPLQSSQGKALDLGRYSNSHRNGNMPEPVSLKMDSSKLISSSNDKRNDVPPGNKHLGPPNLPPNLRQDHSLSRGFQPYRNSDERRSTPPQMYNPSPPPSGISGYPYHPSFAQSSRMPPQLHRLEESVYMERYGLLRPSTMPYPPPSNMIPHPRAPIYPASQYPPELITQSARTYNNSSNSSSRYNHEDENSRETNLIRKREMDLYRENERYLEREESESREREREIDYMKKDRAYLRRSPMTQHSSSRSDTSNEDKGLMGSITHGTPRDYARSLSPPSSTSTTPLNLATSAVSHVDNHMPLKEEYNSRHPRPNISAVNGQMHQRNSNHPSSMGYRKESEPAPYRIHYQMNAESEAKPPTHIEPPENIPTPSHPKPSPYYMEQDNQKPNKVETRTLSIASVINSQINGIFARDNIASNKPYFPPTFYNRPSSSEPQTNNRIEIEFKKAFAAHEASKVKDKSPQSLNSDTLDSKLSGEQQPYAHNGYPSGARQKESSLARVLLRSGVSSPYDGDVRPAYGGDVRPSYEGDCHPEYDGDMGYEGEVRPAEEPQPPVVSVLDAREAKLRKLRMNASFDESEESGIESEEEDDSRLKQLLTVSECPPVKPVFESKKTEFLSKFELVTPLKKFNLEIKKCTRRHKLLREKSPTVNIKVKVEATDYDANHLADLANRLCFSEDFQSRKEFMRVLGLHYLPPEQRSEKEKIKSIITNERLRRNGLMPPSQRCLELQGSHLRKRGCSILNGLKHSNAKRPHLSQDENSPHTLRPSEKGSENQGSSVKDSKSAASSMQRLSSFLKPPMRTVNLPVPPLIPTHQLLSHASEAVADKPSSVVATKDPRARQLKDFAQEFHNSVLQTTQIQLEKKNVPPVVAMETSFPRSPAGSTPEKSEWYPGEHKPPFRWPGLEAIMESYDCHMNEQNAEKKFLLDRCQKLKALNEESNIEAECLAKKQEDLLREKQVLDSHEKELQSSFENLKLFIQHFR